MTLSLCHYTNLLTRDSVTVECLKMNQVCSKFQGKMAQTEIDEDYERVYELLNEATVPGNNLPYVWLRLVDYYEATSQKYLVLICCMMDMLKLYSLCD